MRILFLISFFSLVYSLFLPVFAEGEVDSCEYSGQIEQCIEENKSGDPRSIEDFICLQTGEIVDMAYQIVLDGEMRRIDKDLEEYMRWLEENKDYFFGERSQEDFFRGVDMVEQKLGSDTYGVNKYGDGSIREKYMELFDGTSDKSVLQITMKCLGNQTPFPQGTDFIEIRARSESLVRDKMGRYQDTAYDVLSLNKQQVRKDSKKTFFQARRKGYSGLFDLMTENISYVERLMKKWNEKIKNPYNA